VRPGSTAEVAAVVRACAAAGVAMVPQGGNTGLVGGAVAAGQLIINLGRMNNIREVDAADFTMTVEAGAVLADVQAAAEVANRLFPLSLAAEGSCQIGGNLATNAGGTGVLRYGNMRELTLGLEVVLPSGEVWDGLRRLRKDNTGYDLKHMFIGGEGTLGIITAAVLKLFPLSVSSATAFVGLPDVASALAVFERLRPATGDQLTTFELLTRPCIDMVLAHIPGAVDPLSAPYQAYALIELTSSQQDSGLEQLLERELAAAIEAGTVADAVLARSQAQRASLWHLREAIPEAQKPEGASVKNDISVPVSKVAEFIARAGTAVQQAVPGIRLVSFGHIGDGNIHFNLSQPVGADSAAFLARWDELTGLVSDVAESLGGSFSAEHGIGLVKRSDLARRREPVELALLRQVKQALDPRGLMNPGKMLVDEKPP